MNIQKNLNFWHKISVRALHELDMELTFRQICILTTIYMKKESHSVKSIADYLDIPKAAICRALDSLTQAGLIRRTRDTEDRRITRIHRTMKGSVLLSDMAEIIGCEINSNNIKILEENI